MVAKKKLKIERGFTSIQAPDVLDSELWYELSGAVDDAVEALDSNGTATVVDIEQWDGGIRFIVKPKTPGGAA